MQSLTSFRGHKQLFTDAVKLPPFFESNLLDPARVVKVFENDPQAEIRIFYYQYLKLCFELENVDYDLYIKKIEDIINNPDFQFIFYSNDDPSIFNDTQAKSLIMEFFGVLGEGKQSVLQALTSFPILDKIFIHFFRSMLILSNTTDSLDGYIDRDILLDFLCKAFEVDAEMHGECIRYTETDIFIYELNPAAVYMAFMDYSENGPAQNGQEDASLAIQQPTYDNAELKGAVLTSYNAPQEQTRVVEPQRSNRNDKSLLAKDSYIASEFMDFTGNAEALTAKAKVALKQSGMDQPVVAQVKKQSPPPPPAPLIIKSEPKPIVTAPVAPIVAKDVPVFKEAPKQQLPMQNFNNIPEVQSIASTSKQTQLRSEVIKSEVIKTDNWQSSSSVKTQQQPPNGYQSNFNTANDVTKYSSQTIMLDRSSPPVQVPQISKTQPPQPVNTQLPFNPAQNNFINQSPQMGPYKEQQKNDIYYNPKVANPSLNVGGYTSSKVQESKEVKSATINGAGGKKKPFGLNVSEEFTSTDISRHMAEPHRSNVENMKTRARNFRSSLINVIK